MKDLNIPVGFSIPARWIVVVFLSSWTLQEAVAANHLVPSIEGEWWQIAGDPDLGDYTSPEQQPVDFGIWQAKDGTWQLWSCIRHTNCGGKTRLFYRWEGASLTDSDWVPRGIAMEANPELGETPGGLQAPHVVQVDGRYLMFYGDWNRICLATSEDGKTFERVLNQDGEPDLFTGPYESSRDPMVFKVGNLYHCYYMGHKQGGDYQSAIFCRTSSDLSDWSEPMMVSAGGGVVGQTDWYGGDAECPFVVQKGELFYLFRNQLYGEKNLNTQYASANPFQFGVGDDSFRIGALPVAAPEIIEHEGKEFMAALMPSLKGIRLARLKWQEAPERTRRDPETWPWNVAARTGIPRVHHNELFSRANGKRIGFNVYLPPQYEEADDKFPVVYFLHGAGGTEKSDAGLARLVHSEILAGNLSPAIYVFPNGGQRSGYRDWPDGFVHAETWLMDELIPYVDAQYRTIAEGDARGICGFSMGGGGALRLAIKYPDRFAVAASLAAAIRDRNASSLSPSGEGDDVFAYATRNADRIRQKLDLWMVVGDEDFLYPRHQPFTKHLGELGIDFTYTVHPGVGHNLGILTQRSGLAMIRYIDGILAKHREP